MSIKKRWKMASVFCVLEVASICLLTACGNDATNNTAITDTSVSTAVEEKEKQNNVSAEEVFNFLSDRYYEYYADDYCLNQSQDEYKQKCLQKAADKFGISPEEAQDKYDEFMESLTGSSKGSVKENSNENTPEIDEQMIKENKDKFLSGFVSRYNDYVKSFMEQDMITMPLLTADSVEDYSMLQWTAMDIIWDKNGNFERLVYGADIDTASESEDNILLSIFELGAIMSAVDEKLTSEQRGEYLNNIVEAYNENKTLYLTSINDFFYTAVVYDNKYCHMITPM